MAGEPHGNKGVQVSKIHLLGGKAQEWRAGGDGHTGEASVHASGT